MYYCMTKFSFDPDKNVHGPFATQEDAWQFMEMEADREAKIDIDENGWSTEIVKNKDCGEITITNFFATGTDVTEFFLFEIT